MQSIHKFLIGWLCLLFGWTSCTPHVGERVVNPVPVPAELHREEGLFAISRWVEIGYAEEESVLEGMAARLSAEIERVCGQRLAYASDKASNCIIYLELIDPKEFGESTMNPYVLSQSSQPHDEHYILSIEKENIYLRAVTLEGIYRCISTLTQIVAQNATPAENGKIYLPRLVIKDVPQQAVRGCCLDVPNPFSPSDTEQLIEWIASYKLNVLQLSEATTRSFTLRQQAAFRQFAARHYLTLLTAHDSIPLLPVLRCDSLDNPDALRTRLTPQVEELAGKSWRGE